MQPLEAGSGRRRRRRPALRPTRVLGPATPPYCTPESDKLQFGGTARQPCIEEKSRVRLSLRASFRYRFVDRYLFTLPGHKPYIIFPKSRTRLLPLQDAATQWFGIWFFSVLFLLLALFFFFVLLCF